MFSDSEDLCEGGGETLTSDEEHDYGESLLTDAKRIENETYDALQRLSKVEQDFRRQDRLMNHLMVEQMKRDELALDNLLGDLFDNLHQYGNGTPFY